MDLLEDQATRVLALIDQAYAEAARTLAELLVRQRRRLVYGGGNIGLMASGRMRRWRTGARCVRSPIAREPVQLHVVSDREIVIRMLGEDYWM